MKIALVTATPASVAQGSGTFLAAENLRVALEGLGHQVSVIRPHDAGSARWSLPKRLLFNARLSPARVRAAELVCGFDMDGWKLAGRVPVPYVAYLHGVIADEARFERGLSRWSLATQALAERAAARQADLVLAPSEYSAGQISRLYQVDPSHIRVVPPGIDLGRWRSELARTPPSAIRRPIVFCAGRMYPRKNHAALFRAAVRLRHRIPDVQIRIAGDGPERARLERLARALLPGETVTFLGHVTLEQLAAEYAACRVFCLPSLQEGFGLVFVEAMAAAKPVVACEAAAIPEIVLEGRTGYLVTPGDDAGLAEALARLLEDPERCRVMGEAGRIRAAAFDLDATARAFLGAVDPLLAGRTAETAS